MNDLELDLTEGSESEPSVDDAAKKRRIVIWLIAYAAIFGIESCFVPEEITPIDYVVSLPFLLLGVSWCFTDAVERDHRIGQLMRFLLIFVFIAGLPIYLLQTRGPGVFKAIGWMLLLIATMFVCMVATQLVTFYVGDVTGLWEFDY